MPRQWQFSQDAQGRWRWKRVDDRLGDVDSTASFLSEVDCMMDAMRFAVDRHRPCASRDESATTK